MLEWGAGTACPLQHALSRELALPVLYCQVRPDATPVKRVKTNWRADTYENIESVLKMDEIYTILVSIPVAGHMACDGARGK